MATNRMMTLTAEAREHLLSQCLARLCLTKEDLIELLADALLPRLHERIDERMDKIESDQVALTESVVAAIKAAQARRG